MPKRPKLRPRLRSAPFGVVMLGFLLAACDQGVAYNPREWSRADPESALFRQEVRPGITIFTPGIRSLIADKNFILNIIIHNETDHEVTITRASLVTPRASLEGRFSDGGDEWRRAKPHSDLDVAIGWDFIERVPDVLGEQPVLELELVGAEGRDALSVVFQRQR